MQKIQLVIQAVKFNIKNSKRIASIFFYLLRVF